MKLMKANPAANRTLVLFVGIAYALSIALGIVIGLTGGHNSELIGLGYVSMLIPTMSALITNYATHEKLTSMGWDRFPLKYLPVALP